MVSVAFFRVVRVFLRAFWDVYGVICVRRRTCGIVTFVPIQVDLALFVEYLWY